MFVNVTGPDAQPGSLELEKPMCSIIRRTWVEVVSFYMDGETNTEGGLYFCHVWDFGVYIRSEKGGQLANIKNATFGN